MRSRRERRRRAIAATVALLIALALPAAAAQPSSASHAAAPDAAEIARAIEAVKADPNLGTERTITTLRWKQPSGSKPSRLPAWLSWVAGFFGWLSASARVLVWLVVLALAGLVAVYLARVLRSRLDAVAAEPFIVPTHVHDLDIRPETLPADVGAAARQLWERGERRAALALLYRGMLSRLAHVHGVPIRDSSTEGDCVALAAARLPEDRSMYIRRLVRVWQGFGYGRQEVESTAVYSLCDEFASALGPITPVDAALQPRTA